MNTQEQLAVAFDGSITESVHWRVRGPASSGAPSGIYAVSYESAEAAETDARRDAPLCGVDIGECVLLEIVQWTKIATLRLLEA